ncbi:GNAT family N-acetyltransferase [Thalassospira sp. MCCC 1A01428]|uniref:GNAT family N-acetyltransferase n=1 Tax=Thalassospira sp. MCCC 1A01428 TaxID=1470575 RepID=UPI000A1E4447|nr:GNAT family N-acetyltransferase [Thalassospira sp. MCCC 1A01428]
MKAEQIVWWHGRFDDLELRQLHDLLMLRQQIFIIEQNCIFPEIDGLDPLSFHVLGQIDEKVVAATRIVPAGIDPHHSAQGSDPAIGRVVAASALRGQGVGRAIMMQSIQACEKHFSGLGVFLNGQQHLERFYQGLGFVTEGDPFDEDGIPHISMRRPAI